MSRFHVKDPTRRSFWFIIRKRSDYLECEHEATNKWKILLKKSLFTIYPYDKRGVYYFDHSNIIHSLFDGTDSFNPWFIHVSALWIICTSVVDYYECSNITWQIHYKIQPIALFVGIHKNLLIDSYLSMFKLSVVGYAVNKHWYFRLSLSVDVFILYLMIPPSAYVLNFNETSSTLKTFKLFIINYSNNKRWDFSIVSFLWFSFTFWFHLLLTYWIWMKILTRWSSSNWVGVFKKYIALGVHGEALIARSRFRTFDKAIKLARVCIDDGSPVSSFDISLR